MRSGVDCHWNGQIVGIVRGGMMAIHSSGQTIFSFTFIKGITLGADEVAGGEVAWVWIQ